MRKKEKERKLEDISYKPHHCLLIFKDSNQDHLGIFTLQYPFKHQHILKPAISLIREDFVFNSCSGSSTGMQRLNSW